MSEPKDSNSFFRKVVKFVANPATDWNDIQSPANEVREQEFAKSELKAMIERKRRNDFVRKRELDMLRKVRREGLTSEQLAALGGSSRLDDSEGRVVGGDGARQDGEVKAKIDAIEKQMVGDGIASPSRRTRGGQDLPGHGTSFFQAPTEPSAGPSADATGAYGGRGTPGQPPRPAGGRSTPLLTEVVPNEALFPSRRSAAAGPGAEPVVEARPVAVAPAPGIEVNEVVHDPELDEAVIAFANADFSACEQSLALLTATHGPRAHHAETWLVLFDLYRAVGQQAKFEALAGEYAHHFGWSAPQWFSMPQLVAEATAEQNARAAAGSASSATQAVGWSAPDQLDREAVTRLASRALQMPLPWVLDWSALRGIDPEACARLADLLRGWALQPVEMRWLGGDHLFNVLRDAAPAGVRDVDPAVWRLRLEALRVANRPDQFDEAAIDYCVTYEVSPPSWERAACTVRIGPAGASQLPGGTGATPSSGEVSSGFAESQAHDSTPGHAQCELSGQLTGDITGLLTRVTEEIGAAPSIIVSCARLIRVDFIAAGDLLNWVLSRRAENRQVVFSDANRLVALFFGAMGINEHARVRVRST